MRKMPESHERFLMLRESLDVGSLIALRANAMNLAELGKPLGCMVSDRQRLPLPQQQSGRERAKGDDPGKKMPRFHIIFSTQRHAGGPPPGGPRPPLSPVRSASSPARSRA